LQHVGKSLSTQEAGDISPRLVWGDKAKVMSHGNENGESAHPGTEKAEEPRGA